MADWVSPERAFVVGLMVGLGGGFLLGAAAMVYLILDERRHRR